MSAKNEYIDVKNEHLFDQGEFNVYDTKYTNLSVGAPGPDLLKYCTEYFPIATEHRLKQDASSGCHYTFQYGCHLGNYSFRVTLAKFLAEQYQDEVNYKSLVLTSGASNGLHLILSTLVDMSGVIFVDEVTYMIVLEAFSQFSNMKLVTVPLNEDGPDVEELKRLIEENKCSTKDKLFWGLYYTIPTYHNPTGRLFSEKICQQISDLSKENDLLIVCDDVYNLLPYKTDTPTKRLFAYGGNVISNGSFTKILSPGVRVGWLECPPKCIDAFAKSGILKSGGAVNNYTSGIVQSLIELGLASEMLNIYKTAYKTRMETTCKILREKLPSSCSFLEPKGGYFIWIELPEAVNAQKFNEFCREKYQLIVIPGNIFSLDKKFTNCIRITIGFQTNAILQTAIPRLCLAINEFINLPAEK